MSKRRLVYILSPSYSGSTLLTMLMARHPGIATIGELKATSMGDIQEYRCSCGELITECSFWDRLKNEMSERGSEFDLENFGTHFDSNNSIASKILKAQVRSGFFETIRKVCIESIPSVRSEYSRILEKNRLMIEAICQLQSKDVFLDGSKDPNRLLYLKRADDWDIRIIKMYRDGRAQSNSNRQKEISGMNYEQSVREWKWTIDQMEKTCGYFPENTIFELTYEHLCNDPNGSMEKIWNFLNLDKLDCDWSELEIKSFEHHILGNSMRTKDKIFISLDQGWKKKVTQSELVDFEKIAGTLNRRLGYTE